jgi:hypothetical protein
MSRMDAEFPRCASSLGRAACGFWAVCFLAVLGVLAPCARGAALPSADEVLRRLAERAEKRAAHPPAYEYTRTRLTRLLDGDRKLESEEQEVFRMLLRDGKLEPHLVSKNGQPVSDATKPDQDEKRSRTSSRDDREKREDALSGFLTSEVAKRFTYEVIALENLEDRPCYLLKFEARPDLPVSGIEEKVMARTAGKLWVDKEDDEVVRVESGMTKPLRIALGIVGVLHDLRFSVERRRLENGQWANAGIHLRIHFRQLFETKHVEFDETASDFVVMPGAVASPSPIGQGSTP